MKFTVTALDYKYLVVFITLSCSDQRYLQIIINEHIDIDVALRLSFSTRHNKLSNALSDISVEDQIQQKYLYNLCIHGI